MTRLGELLKGAREEQGLTLEQVEEAIHIRRHMLEALEGNELKKFPSPVITRGLIRNYAKYLNLDPIEALTLYDGNGIVPVKGQRLTPNGIEFMNLSMAPRPFISWDFIFGMLLFLVVIGGFGYITYTTVIQPGLTPTPTKTPSAAGLGEDAALLLPTVTPLPTSTPTPLPPTDTPTPIIYGGVTVELQLKQPSWIQILVDDVKTFEGILQPGESKNWTGQRRVAIRAGNAGGVEVIVNGINRGVMGGEGQVVDQIWEKVDDPAALTPQPDPANTLSPTATLPLTPGSGETPLPLESVPQTPPAEGQPSATPQS
ncbi:MAG: helix-turn-helix domain-containing protein [Chloroflexota bacterium]|nr:MAG: helix-turn-helix domain-containing protein [Chloroflexota bacterium]